MSEPTAPTVETLKNHVEAARWVSTHFDLALGHDERLYRYDSGVYRPDGQQVAEEALKRAMGTFLPPQLLTQVVRYLKAGQPAIDPDTHDPDVINFTNGVLNWRTGAFEEHTPLNVSTIQIPHRYVPGARAPRILEFLTSVSPEDDEGQVSGPRLFLEMMGYAMIPTNSLQKMFLLHGPGGNGKSQVLHLLRALLGPANYSTVTVQDLAGDNKFAAADLQGKLANIAGDLDAKAIKRTDVLKMISGGDPIRAERKNQQPFKFVPFALQVFSANEVPLTHDQSEAWFDRWVVVPMLNRFRGTSGQVQDIGLVLAADEAEMEGLVQHCLYALHGLMERGHFTIDATVAAAQDTYRLESDSVRQFLTERTALDPTADPIGRDYLYASYKAWAEDGGRIPVKQNTFTRRVLEKYARAQVALTEDGRDIKDAGGNRQWRGIRVGG